MLIGLDNSGESVQNESLSDHTDFGGKRRHLNRLHKAIRILSSFFLGQGALQGVQLLITLFLVRKLSVEAYAQFGLAFAFQVTVGSLMDFGISAAIIPLVGERHEDRVLVGQYVRSAKHVRDWAFWILAPLATVAFLEITHRHHWSWGQQLLLLSSVLLALYSSGQLAYASAPLFLRGRLQEFYIPQTLAGLARFAAYGILRFAGALNAWTAAWLNALAITINGNLIAKKSTKYMVWPHQSDPAKDRELFRFVLPATPAIVFGAFQSQISLFLISIFGETTNIAEVAALSKIGQLFSVLMIFNTVVIEPYIAKLNRKRLLPIYLSFLALAATFCVPVVFIAFMAPNLFLWLLGPKYQNLGDLVGWVVLTACINYLAGLVWIMNRARKWIFWSGSFLEIILLLVVQTAFVAYIGIRSTKDAVLLAFAASFCYVICHGYVAIYGFLGKPQEI